MTKNKSTLKSLASLAALIAASLWIITFASEQKTEQAKVESDKEVRNK